MLANLNPLKECLQTAIITTDSIDARNRIPVVQIVFLFVKSNKGINTKAAKYQHLAKKNFKEITQSVEKRTVTAIHTKLQNKRTIKGCFVFAEICEGLKRKYAKSKTVISHMIGSSGRSVESELLRLYSNDHGKEKTSR